MAEMLTLRLLGSPVLERDGVVLTGRCTQRHRLGLLALLALAPGQRLSRDRLLGCLWPERDLANARNLLKVSTHVLRSDLGKAVLITENDQLRLNPEMIVTDVAEFSTAFRALDYVRATEVYRGPFMDGFFIAESTEFEEWASGERRRLELDYGISLEKIAVSAGESGNAAEAAEWWTRRAVHDPLDTRVALRLIEALQASGSAGAALRHAAAHEALLREEYGASPSPEFMDAVRHLSDRSEATAAAAWTQLPEPQAPAVPVLHTSADVVTRVAPRRNGRIRGHPRVLMAAVVLLIVLATASYSSQDRELAVVPRAATPVSGLLQGSLPMDGERLHVTVQLIDAASGNPVWTGDYERPVHSFVELQEQIARDIVHAVELRRTGGAAGSTRSAGPEHTR